MTPEHSVYGQLQSGPESTQRGVSIHPAQKRLALISAWWDPDVPKSNRRVFLGSLSDFWVGLILSRAFCPQLAEVILKMEVLVWKSPVWVFGKLDS